MRINFRRWYAKEVVEMETIAREKEVVLPKPKIKVRKAETGPWVSVHEGLEGKLLLMKTLGFTCLKYILLPHDVAASLLPPRQLPNTLTSSDGK